MVHGLEATESEGLGPFDRLAAGLLALIAATTLPTRQILMPAINRGTDTDANSPLTKFGAPDSV